tara:strand:- start:942 stop:2405 length:1464 start_codon:yes stop_codon:yes gene_type:complete
MARIKPGVPTIKEIREGESEYRYIHGTGLVLYTRYSNQIYSTKMHAASTPPVMDKKLEMAIGDRIGASIEGDEFIRADGTVQFTGNQSHGGHDIVSVNDLDVDGDIDLEGDIDVNGTANLDNTDVDGTLDVDGATTLDQTTINTTDGDFSVTGPNDISFVTTGTSMDTGIVLNSSLNFNMDVTRNCDWNTDAVDWDTSGTFDLTSVDDLTIETSGAAEAKTILLFNDNNHASAFRGIHLKVDSQDTNSCQNSILIECTNRAAKGGGIGVDIASDDGVLIRAEDANDDADSYVQIRATGCVDIGGNQSSLTPSSTYMRTKIHGTFETDNLFRFDSADPIIMDRGTILTGDTPNEIYTKFEALDTYKLMRAMTFKTSASVARTASHTIVSATDDDNAAGTVWLITIVWRHAADDVNSQLWMCSAVGSADNTLISVKIAENLESSEGIAAGSLLWDSAGIVWTNGHDATSGSTAVMKASALRIQSGTLDF